MRTRETDEQDLVNMAEITEIELRFLRTVRSLTPGEHWSMAQGTGFDFVGLRDWQSGDRFSSIDWAQSSLTNFSPLIVREFDQSATASVVAVTDRSLSTRCGVDGVPIAAVLARAIATIGMSAVFFQDQFGLITFDAGLSQMEAIQPRIGKSQVVRCLRGYQHSDGMQQLMQTESLSTTLGSFMRKTSLVPFISDFLFDDPRGVLGELALLDSTHDVFIVLIDSAFAFGLSSVSAGWIEVVDVETGRSRMLSRSAVAKMAEKVREWQDDVERMAKSLDLDVLRLGVDQTRNDVALAEFVVERRLRKAS